MKYRILTWMFLLGCLAACKDEEETGFDVPVEFRKIAFEPVPGGAVMRYSLPGNMDIFGVRARYKDAYGRELVKEGTYLTDTILLTGFAQAQTDVPVQITFFNNRMEESLPKSMTFSTQPAATVALFERLSVNPFWGGFNVTYTSPSVVEGFIYVYYEGINPTTKQLDNILIGSYAIQEGGDTLNFELKQDVNKLNVTVRTDDFDGNRVMEKTYPDIPALSMEMLAPEKFDFFASQKGLIMEDEEHAFGKAYLFDGKKKGANYRENVKKGSQSRYKYGTFVAGPDAFGERFIIDFKTPRIPAMLRGDAFLYHGYSYPYANSSRPDPNIDQVVAKVFSGVYTSRLPSKIAVYGTNAEDPKTVDIEQCVLLYKLDEEANWSNFYSNAWCRLSDYGNGPAYEEVRPYNGQSDEVFEAADPISLEMKCNYTGEAFRYVFFIVEDTWPSYRNPNKNPNGAEENPYEYITFDELEVFVKMENE